jgi:hypothetical protein
MRKLCMKGQELPAVPNLKGVPKLETADVVRWVREQLKPETKTQSENQVFLMLV